MSYDFWTTRECSARKPHHCDECNGAIAVGERYQRGAGKWDGSDMLTSRLCLTCAEIIDETWHTDLWDSCEGYPAGDVRSHLRDALGVKDAVAWAKRHRAARLAKRNRRELDLDRDTFLSHMAERFRARVRRPGLLGWLRIPYSREWAAGQAQAAFEAYIEREAIGGAQLPFGHPDYDWSRAGAFDVVDSELSYWDEA